MKMQNCMMTTDSGITEEADTNLDGIQPLE